MSALLLLFTMLHPALAHGGHSAPRSWAVCAESELGDACAWQDDAQDLYRGTCRQIADTLACVRNRPIVAAHTSRATPTALLGALIFGGWATRRVRGVQVAGPRATATW